jgi:hypothetical protein
MPTYDGNARLDAAKSHQTSASRLSLQGSSYSYNIVNACCKVYLLINPKEKDKERDEMLKQAGYIVKRYNYRNIPDKKTLEKDFRQIIQKYNLLKHINLDEVEKNFHKLTENF